MTDSSARLLRLRTLLQTRRDWSTTQLADRLGINARMVRTDISRLRSLGYTVPAAPGGAGGYCLGAGAALPPQLLDDEAVAVGLRTPGGGTVEGIEDASPRCGRRSRSNRSCSRVCTLLQASMVALTTTATTGGVLRY